MLSSGASVQCSAYPAVVTGEWRCSKPTIPARTNCTQIVTFTPDLKQLMMMIKRHRVDSFLHWAIPRPTLLHESYSFPPYYWKSVRDSCSWGALR